MLTRVRRTAAVWAVVAATGLLAACADDEHGGRRRHADDAALALDAAVRVVADGCSGLKPMTGGGSFVGDELVVTVAHVVAGADDVTVTIADGRTLPATVVAIDRAKDLAVLRVEAEVAPLPLGTMAVGAKGAYVVHRDERPEAMTARVESFVDLDVFTIDRDGTALRRGYQLRATVLRGDSGTVVVSGGRATAVIFATSTEAGARTWATDISEAAPLLDGPTDRAVDVGECA
jgi:hypothetical protein